uniref:Uncharacterized protein n=1 Tax=Arundo donax TaxID=35708 RepID=A0A0A9CY27_ARUDO
MRRISEMSNIYNPNKNTYPCYHLCQKSTKFIKLFLQRCRFILCSQHSITYTSHCSIRTNPNNNCSCSTSYNNSAGKKNVCLVLVDSIHC